MSKFINMMKVKNNKDEETSVQVWNKTQHVTLNPILHTAIHSI